MAKLFKTARQRRFDDLVQSGFTVTEAIQLSKISKSVPYIRDFKAERKAEHDRWIKRGKTEEKWQELIKRRYIMRGYCHYFTSLGIPRNHFTFRAVWNQIRNYESRFRDSHPTYKSPWQLSKKASISSQDFQDKVSESKKANAIAKFNDEIKLLRQNIRVLKDKNTIERYRSRIISLQRQLDKINQTKE